MERNSKEIIQYSTACIMLASGIILSFLSFFIEDEHTIDDSVLWYFAQTIIYAGSVFGLTLYVSSTRRQIIAELEGKLNGSGGKDDAPNKTSK